MSVVERSVWYIESNLSRELNLDDIAKGAGVSKYHLCHVFVSVTGVGPMRYLRARRIETAAEKLLVDSKRTILDIAIEYGYGSHEAFSRAFRNHIGIPPDDFRRSPEVVRPRLAGAFRHSSYEPLSVKPVRYETRGAFTVSGISKRYTWETNTGIPAQWATLQSIMTDVSKDDEPCAYGVCTPSPSDRQFLYTCGFAEEALFERNAKIETVSLPAATYAVYLHTDHISTLTDTTNAIWNTWTPPNGQRIAHASDFELYDCRFDPETGLGGVEIWVPLAERAKHVAFIPE